MLFGISSSERKGWFSITLFKKNLTRFWPLWALYGMLWFFQMPVKIFLTGEDISLEYQAEQLRIAIGSSTYAGLGYGLLLAMALFSYLMNTRSTGMLHALPVRREGLFLTNFVSGFVLIVGPTLAVALITLALQACNQMWLPGEVFLWFVLNLMITLMYFAFAVCCAMFTGNILALPVFYLVLNNLVWGVNELLAEAAERLLFGYQGVTPQMITLCTPVIFLITNTACVPDYRVDTVGMANGFLNAMCYSLVLFCVFTSIAVLVYRRRQLERAGDVITVGWVRPIFQYGVGVCVGLALGLLLYTQFFRDAASWVYIACVVLCALVGTFGAKMLLKKSLRVFGEWKGPGVLCLCMLVLMVGVRLDILGVERKVPNIDQVESIWFGAVSKPADHGRCLILTVYAEDEPELVERIVEFHKALVVYNERLKQANLKWANEGRYTLETWDDEGYKIEDTTYVSIDYKMKDGKRLRRCYQNVPILENELADPDSYAAQLQAIINDPWMVREAYGLDGDAEIKTVGGNFVNADSGMDTVGQHELSDEEVGRLWDAFLEDLDAGRVRRYLLDDRERMENCYYYNDINFHLATHIAGVDYEMSNVKVTPEKSMTSLMAAMKELGLDQYLSDRNGVAD